MAAARRHRGELPVGVVSALTWLEARKKPPIIVAPVRIDGSAYRLSVPNNAMDIVAAAWTRGNASNSGDADERTHRTMKAVRPTLLSSEAVHYLWPVAEPITEEIRNHVQVLGDVARSVVSLGWGIDMAVGHGAMVSSEEAEVLPGERWLAIGNAKDGGLRVPVERTLEDLVHRHKGFLARIGPEGFTAPPPLSAFRRVEYRHATDPAPRPVAAFSLLKLDASGFRPFDTARKGLTVAGMMRGVAKAAAERGGWPESKINAFILGHGEGFAAEGRRFAYVPLPSVEARGPERARVAGSVRRMMLTAFNDGCEEEFAWARRSLSGLELVEEATKQPLALLSLIPENERMVRYYLQSASEWATVSPMVLPGYDDPRHYRRRMKRGVGPMEQKNLLVHLDDRVDGLIRKAIVQAGFSQDLANQAELEWRKVGFWPGADLADRYGIPVHLKRFPRFHVRIGWRDAQKRTVHVEGPMCLGGGRFYGLGLFAPI